MWKMRNVFSINRAAALNECTPSFVTAAKTNVCASYATHTLSTVVVRMEKVLRTWIKHQHKQNVPVNLPKIQAMDLSI